jgi:predicted ATP-grasp superfamily ATP-dependent carboligase
VLGNTNLVRALALGGVRSAVVARRNSPVAYSRFTAERIEWADNWGDPEHLAANLVAFGRRHPGTPLFFQHDGDLMFVSKHRETLGRCFRIAIGHEALIEQLVEKTRFIELARRTRLPIPDSLILDPAEVEPAEISLAYPLVLKPVTRRDVTWGPLAGHAKALEVDTPAELHELWPRLAATGVELVAQSQVPGAEDRIESYHAYVDERGEVAGEFTGRKVRTRPAKYGETTACVITDEGDVRELGRHCMSALGLRGVAKLDFKRAPDGALFLLEVNARFNLWHLPGAVAGVNLPALVYADLCGLPRPTTKLRPGVRWSLPWYDVLAAREQGVPLRKWVPWQIGCETHHIAALDDPMPFLRGMIWRRLRRRLRR